MQYNAMSRSIKTGCYRKAATMSSKERKMTMFVGNALNEIGSQREAMSREKSLT